MAFHEHLLLGMIREDAEALLHREGIPYEVEETAPERLREPLNGPWRVIRQKEQNGKLLLTVCRVPALQQ
ncbi:MAG: hypothetical protein E7223_03490 [Clostridiales bacterium]|nr:hypothetical protein [Clostridiales bacterium]